MNFFVECLWQLPQSLHSNLQHNHKQLLYMENKETKQNKQETWLALAKAGKLLSESAAKQPSIRCHDRTAFPANS